MNNNIALPFVKVVGGKRQLLPELLKHVPTKFSDYYEPFVGGGALFFRLQAMGALHNAYLSDMNSALLLVYTWLKHDAQAVVKDLAALATQTSEEAYYNHRAKFNEYRTADAIKSTNRASYYAALYIYLNKTCFNGLWRVNRSGLFNAPYGKYANPKILDNENLANVGLALRKAKLTCSDFSTSMRKAGHSDFIYCDPPYVPVSPTANFTAYTCDGFTMDDQIRLHDTAVAAAKRGVYVMVSNAKVPVVIDLYNHPPFRLHFVEARRAINCKGSARGPVGEVIITTY